MHLDQESTFDKILASVGDDGPYQKFLFWAFMASFGIVIPYSGLVQFFQISLPNHWCHVPGKPENFSIDLWRNMTIPWEEMDGKLTQSKCNQYVEVSPIIEVAGSARSDYSSFKDTFGANPITSECQSGWDYDKTSYESTLATEQNWVCESESNSATWLTILNVGNLFGTLIFTYFGDKIGRKPTLVFCTVLHITLSIARLYLTQWLWLIYLMALISGFTFPYLIQITSIIVYEQVSPKWRERTIGVCFNSWITGICILPLIAYLCRDWKTLGIVTTIMHLPVLIVFFYIHETPRWLATQGELEKSKKILKKIAKTNGKEWCDEIENNLESVINVEKEHSEHDQDSFIELLRHKTLRLRTLLLTYACITNTVIYYGIIYNTHNLSGNEFLNFFYLSIVEYPGNFMGWAFGKWFGRRWTQVFSFALASLCLLKVLFIPDDANLAKIILLLICKMLICVSFAVIYMQYVEIFPTSHRASGIGFVTSVTTIAVFGVPYMAYGATLFLKFPYMILLFVGVSGTIAAAFLPETMGISLPQTIEEGEHSVRDQKFWSYYGWRPNVLRSRNPNNLNSISGDISNESKF